MSKCVCRLYDKNRAINFYLPDGSESLNIADYFAEAAVQLFDYWYDRNYTHDSLVMANLPWVGPVTVLPPDISNCLQYAVDHEWEEYPVSDIYNWKVKTDGTVWWLYNSERKFHVGFVEVMF